jgi:hypothetical protein
MRQKKSYFLTTLVRQLMYPIRRHLPFFLQGVSGDVEHKISRKTNSAADKASFSKKQKESIKDTAWSQAIGGPDKIITFLGEVRCDKCVNK